jgi:hypothetical protein
MSISNRALENATHARDLLLMNEGKLVEWRAIAEELLG